MAQNYGLTAYDWWNDMEPSGYPDEFVWDARVGRYVDADDYDAEQTLTDEDES